MKKINKVIIIIIGLFLLISYFKGSNKDLIIDNNNLNKNYIAINDEEQSNDVEEDVIDNDSLNSGIKITSIVDKEDITDWSFKLHVKIIYSYGNNVSEDIILDKDNNTVSYLVGHENVFFEITEEVNEDYDIEFSGLEDGVQKDNKYYGVFNTDSDSFLNISITNKYKYNDLIIKKKVTGYHKVSDNEFKLKVIFNNNDNIELDNSYKYVLNNKDEGTLELTDEENSKVGIITLKENDTLVIKNIPIGITYQIIEEDLKEYKEVTKNVTGVIEKGNKDIVFTSKARIYFLNIEIEYWIMILLLIIILGAILVGIKVSSGSIDDIKKIIVKRKKQTKKTKKKKKANVKAK